MSFKVISTDPRREVTVKKAERYPLTVRHNAYIEGLTAVSLRHDIYAEVGKSPVFLLPQRGVFLSRNLWVESSLIEDGIVQTYAFNMSDKRLLIKRGEVVSFLISI